MAVPYKVQMKGLIRFSYLSEGGYALSSKTPEEIRAILYDPDRLARRFQLFEALTLPSIRIQRNENYKLGVLVGECFPEDAKSHLKTLIADVPQIKLITLPYLPMPGAVRRAFDALGSDPQATHTATFRLDDDDAMHRMTTARIAKVATRLLAFRDREVPFGIGFNRGFYLDASKLRKPVSEWYEKTPLGIGLTLVAPVDMQVNIFRRNHRKLAEFYDCYTETSRPMYIRSVHQDNDSSAKSSGHRGEMTQDEITRSLKRGFGVRLEDLKALHVS